MQKCEFDKPIKKKELLNALLMSKMDQVEIAILDGDFHDAIEILDDAYHLCLDADEMDMAVPFFEEEKLFKAKLGMQANGNDASTASNADPVNESETSNKRAAMKLLLKTMLLLSMRKNMARIQKNKNGH